MKKIIFLSALLILLLSNINAQVLRQGNFVFVTTNPAADPLICLFGNTIEDVTLLTSIINLKGKDIRDLRQKEEVTLHQNITKEAQRVNARYISLHIVQRDADDLFNKGIITHYFIVEIYERVGNRYYLIATNNY